MNRAISVILLTICTLCSTAQVQVESRIDSIQMLIGEQVHLTLSVTMKQGQTLQMPSFKPMEHLIPGVEVLAETAADTSAIDNGDIRVSKIYTLTSFDDSLYYLPPMKANVDGKEYASKSLALKVLTVPVDTLHPERFYPPKDVQDNPFAWSEWRPLFLMSLLLIVILCLTIYLYVRLRDNKPIVKLPRIVKRLLPHEKAMKEIEKIKAEHIASSENQKEYYTRLTDTLRIYIEERFGFRAMEMTSTEIISRLEASGDEQMIDELRQLFSTADLVKFAKYSALINENDANLVHAIEYINATKQESMPEKAPAKPKLTEADKRSRRSRITLKAVIIAGCVICALLLVYVIYKAYLLL